MLIGLEILLNSIKETLKCKSDVIIAALHTFLLNSNYVLIGLGNVEEANDSNGTEILLPGWNDIPDAYILRYRRKIGNETRTLLVKAIKSDNFLLINVIENPGELTGSVELTVDTYITDNYKSYATAFKESSYLNQLEEKFRKEIYDKITMLPSKSNESQNNQQRNTDPLRVNPRQQFYPNPNFGRSDLDPFSQPFPNIGGKDLDPFGRVSGPGGGMILDPRDLRNMNVPNPRNPSSFRDPRYPSFPPGAIVPGARFDPIAPNLPGDRPNRPRTTDPDPDHFQPPGYDDMFM